LKKDLAYDDAPLLEKLLIQQQVRSLQMNFGPKRRSNRYSSLFSLPEILLIALIRLKKRLA
jgi:hypothetical protein